MVSKEKPPQQKSQLQQKVIFQLAQEKAFSALQQDPPTQVRVKRPNSVQGLEDRRSSRQNISDTEQSSIKKIDKIQSVIESA